MLQLNVCINSAIFEVMGYTGLRFVPRTDGGSDGSWRSPKESPRPIRRSEVAQAWTHPAGYRS